MIAALIYPHQLFARQPATAGAQLCVLVEEPLLFSQYRFHRQKLILHRAAMQAYAARLRASGEQVRYFAAHELADSGAVASRLRELGVTQVRAVDPSDDWLATRFAAGCRAAGLALSWCDDPDFLTSDEEFARYAAGRKKLFFTDFSVAQRKRLGVLLDEGGRPVGGKWSFDPENRRKLPRDVQPPPIDWPAPSRETAEASAYVREQFPQARGQGASFRYPTTHAAATVLLEDFLDRRLADFGAYEDAIDRDRPYLFHSVLTSALNCGLLSPRQVVDAALARADRVPLNSLEGFVRQVIGWREFVRGVYRRQGRRQRTRNFWNHRQPMPAAFYDGTTGIEPVDVVIRRVLEHGYCHHIERLMILGTFLLLCEVDPQAVYQWFMELFVDAYDWVMVPNVYGMSQFADGGLMTTKPYLCGSSYVLRMSNFRRGPWAPIWDALYWRFVDRRRDFFAANPRTSMTVRQLEKLGAAKLDQHRRTAEEFLQRLHGLRAV